MSTSFVPGRLVRHAAVRCTTPRHAAVRRTTAPRRVVLATVLAALLGGGTVTMAQARTTHPYWRGPAPTTRSITAPRGPFTTATARIDGDGGFGSATVYYPTTIRQGTYGVVAIVPGFMGYWSWMDWLGPRLASHGFVVIGVDTDLPWDLPDDRGQQIEAAVRAVRKDPRIARVGDFDRVALSGWSMGGGGILDAAVRRSYRALIPIAPWETDNPFAKVTTPTLIIGGQSDAVAPDASMAIPFYEALGGKKAFLELARADHFFTTDPSDTQAAAMIAWLKLYVDGDTRYTSFICPRPAVGGAAISRFRSAC
ncbi:MAG TPA: alpha/beta hydrolase [Kineosporiaceae bacterium]